MSAFVWYQKNELGDEYIAIGSTQGYYREFISLKTKATFPIQRLNCSIVLKDILVNIFFLSKKIKVFENLIFSLIFILNINPI